MGQAQQASQGLPPRTANTYRVAFFSPYSSGGGAEKAFRRLAQGLAEAGLHVDILVANASQAAPEGGPEGVRLIGFGQDRVMACAPGLVRYLKTESPHVLLSTLTHANVLAVWAVQYAHSAGTQLILREANTLSVEASQSPNVRGRSLPVLARAFYPCSEAVVAVSKGVAADLVDRVGIPRAIVRTIYNPTYDPQIKRRMEERPAHPWLSDGGEPIVLSVGRLTKQKRYDLLIRAVGLLRRERPIRVLILGEGEERPHLLSLVRELGIERHVSLPGFVSNPYPYMALSDLYVVSSSWEGFPNTIVEALACGLPVVSTDCPSGPREILDCRGPGTGRYGTLSPVDNVGELASAIRNELAHQRDSSVLVQRAALFSAERAVRSYLDLVYSLAGRERAQRS